MCRVRLLAECITCALSMYSPDYVFTVLVSTYIMKTHNHFQALYIFTGICSKSDGVLCFHYSRMRIANDTYYVPCTYVRTNVTNIPTPPACLGTPVPRLKNKP